MQKFTIDLEAIDYGKSALLAKVGYRLYILVNLCFRIVIGRIVINKIVTPLVELEARIFFLLPPISLDVDGSASAAGCVNQEPLSLAARALLLSLSNDSSLFLDFLGPGLLLDFIQGDFSFFECFISERERNQLLQRVRIMPCKQNMQIHDAQCNSRSQMSFGAKNVIALLDA